jgi:hypothetical protein
MPVTTRSGKTYTSTSSKKKTKKKTPKTPTKSKTPKTPTTPMRKKIAKNIATAAAKSARTRKAQQTIRSKKSTIPTRKHKQLVESIIDNTTGIAQDVTKNIIMELLDLPKDIKTYREGQMVQIFLSKETINENILDSSIFNYKVGKIIKRLKVDLNNQRGLQYRYVVLTCDDDNEDNFCEETFIMLYSDDMRLLDNIYSRTFTDNKHSIVTPMDPQMRYQGREIQTFLIENKNKIKTEDFQNKMITQLKTNPRIRGVAF